MPGSEAALMNPRRLVIWYALLALVGLVLMVNAGRPGAQPQPTFDIEPVVVTTEGSN